MLLDTMRSQSFTLLGVKYQGCLVGVAGYFVENRVLTTPIFGYDTALPSSLGLYRMLTALMMQEAKKLGCQYHMSSGVGHFKRQRGGVQYLESMAMYTDHLPKFRRWPWRFLGAVFNYLAKPLLVRYKL